MARTRAAAAAPDRRARLKTWSLRVILAACALVAILIVAFSVLRPPGTMTMLSERMRLGGISRSWVPLEDIAPVAARSVVAAEDANFCRHWGFDMTAIRQAIDAGGRRGASTISQQTVKNVFLWQGRSWPRKALEAAITPAVELVWTKRRILEVYLNVSEMGEGVFGIGAAAQHWFGVPASELTAEQAARIAAILPAPRERSPADPSDFVRRRAAQILDGAETIRRDGRAACFSPV